MKGEAIKLIKIFDGGDKRFIIPLYQRNYDWKEANCKQLFDDLISIYKTPERKSHFFGSIVSQIQGDTDERYIIDGQQRITTVSLILIAMVNAAKNGDLNCGKQSISNEVFRRYLVDEYSESERKVKLKPIKNDMNAFDALLYKDKSQYIQKSNVTRNYNYFYNSIVSSKLSFEDLFESVRKLEIIDIKLSQEDDAQLIFESLNSTGLDLSEADKIRNYILMSMPASEQEKLYEKYWNPIEECTNYEATNFVRDYLTLKTGKISKIDQIYIMFKRYVEDNNCDKSVLLSDMYAYAQIYKNLDACSTGLEIDKTLRELKTLESKVAYPFFMSLLDCYEKKDLDENQLSKVFAVVENCWARRIICGKPSNVFSKLFSTLHREVMNRLRDYQQRKSPDSKSATYYDVLVYTMLKKDGSSLFPSDEEVKEDLLTRQVYKIQNPQRVFLMERFENRNSIEVHDVVGQVTSGDITIEHIMPQTLSKEWKDELGDYERIHGTYLHTIANLTLTGYNSQYSNLPFAQKRDMEKGFKDSAFRLNNDIKTKDKWGEPELRERGMLLQMVCFDLWPMPTSSFVPIEKDKETASLDDEDYNFSGKDIIAFSFRDVRYSVSNWKEMYVKLCAQCLVENKATMEWLCANSKCGLANSFSANVNSTSFSEGLYVCTNNSTSFKIHNMVQMLNECGIALSDVKFEFSAKGKLENAEQLSLL